MSGGDTGTTTPRPPVTQRPHVVIVSDDPDLRDFLGQGLLFAGFWTSAIASGIQVIEVFRLRGFDLVIIDANIRGLPAVEIIRRLRGRGASGPDQRPVTLVPIVVVDPTESVPERDRFLDAGADALLEPPLELDQVAIQLMGLVASWREANPDRPWADASVPQARGPRAGDGD